MPIKQHTDCEFFAGWAEKIKIDMGSLNIQPDTRISPASTSPAISYQLPEIFRWQPAQTTRLKKNNRHTSQNRISKLQMVEFTTKSWWRIMRCNILPEESPAKNFQKCWWWSLPQNVFDGKKLTQYLTHYQICRWWSLPQSFIQCFAHYSCSAIFSKLHKVER